MAGSRRSSRETQVLSVPYGASPPALSAHLGQSDGPPLKQGSRPKPASGVGNCHEDGLGSESPSDETAGAAQLKRLLRQSRIMDPILKRQWSRLLPHLSD